jgi:hypothetical protein
MQFFLCEIVARIVAIYMCLDCSRDLWHGFADRKIERFNPDWISWIVDWADRVVYRDTMPVRYWMEIGTQITLLFAALFVAIFGWWLPST